MLTASEFMGASTHGGDEPIGDQYTLQIRVSWALKHYPVWIRLNHRNDTPQMFNQNIRLVSNKNKINADAEPNAKWLKKVFSHKEILSDKPKNFTETAMLNAKLV